ncbi:Histone acetyltransferase [Komagataella phaffii CBS 7435]|uniref:histone acetyltransferase n=2 Tax=Komagataella phaffii TaxID=460519 RepID=C4R5G3_KOMPG|nr:Histone acetyltransferase critical for cell survival in the presence of DNA damage during S phase [Komagataella phaffii GS115]AOA64109.1 GQ67_03846T0 [Komagataella phaffii]CAH2449417.1 Histone acetyltransferase [Komagataella phaffii CBS 7435]AOA68698.1 GQ68_03819T0 [Komagataella phaffii GS115]CAY70799.1 Histone acetyltransferase critical for cell survival in the presence of DNA damage during S phase [Komagataella phaffii GS115]CCA39406.1 Histone acetyltransferase [Komagataella phaffii CBS 7
MSLSEYLQEFLPKDTRFDVLHVQSQPKVAKNVVCGLSEDSTCIKIQHFIVLYSQKVPVIGLEVHRYVIIHRDHTQLLLFVSKADTAGLISVPSLKVGLVVKSCLKFILQLDLGQCLGKVLPRYPTFESVEKVDTVADSLKFLADISAGRESFNPKTHYVGFEPKNPIIAQICMFTRPEPQYLFPNSGKNHLKHQLSGESLLRWWIRIIDELVTELDFHGNTKFKVTIPGAEKSSILKYLPNEKWEVGDIFSSQESDIAVYKIPLLPDDPKGRFLEHLVVEGRAKSTSIQRFWLELSARQEFRLGITVGVIGVSGELGVPALEKVKYEEMVVFRKKKFLKLKLFVTGEDYSSVEEINSFNDIKNVFGDEVFSSIVGRMEIPSQESTISKPSIRAPPLVNDLTSMIRRRK